MGSQCEFKNGLLLLEISEFLFRNFSLRDKLDDELDEYFGRDPQDRAKARLDADLDAYWNQTEEKETPAGNQSCSLILPSSDPFLFLRRNFKKYRNRRTNRTMNATKTLIPSI